MPKFEEVRVRFGDNRVDEVFLVRCTDEIERTSCLGYLKDCGHNIDTKEIERPVGKRTITYGRLSDIVEPRDA